jgi:hypothetical protein
MLSLLTNPDQEKPPWMISAAEIKAEIDRLPYTKSIKKKRRRIVEGSYYPACGEHGYLGSFHEWDYLCDHVGRRLRQKKAEEATRSPPDFTLPLLASPTDSQRSTSIPSP